MNTNEVMEVLNFRHACKEFDATKKIDDKELNVVLEGGRLAASSMGIEPWKFIVVENHDLKEELSRVCFGGTKQISTCSHFVIYLSRTPKEIKSDSAYIDYILKDVKKLPEEVSSMMKGFMKSFEGTVLKDDKDMQSYANEQNYIALSSMMLSAAMLNIDSCVIGGMDKEALTKILVDRGLLDTDKFQVTVTCAFGYRKNEASPKLRQPMDEVVTWVK
ncbi:NAD(P)H-dependent oxidoreductase [Romboutsia weinsteinii]|uniref:NAD(P)H-dependent oxidoreductase n=1 Tax=Romboutsia weinsteinii TaxID=2020949 RepID=A0A371J303_9FIRM|nr:NAD(P)H-dependent oxidoreductase [Romboutsia weinsteinii]RDY27064.1 NAD(P)H-dependent oxidoreductase [Romboutsia weinsteinii]